MNIIETQQLTRRYGRHDAVNGLDLAVPEGSIFAFLGTNGAGKTTLIKVLVNLLSPSRGQASILGVDTRRLGPAEFSQVGYVSENQMLPETMTVGQFLGYCRGFYPTWDCELERTLLRRFDLPAGKKLKHLSRGMKMKAALLSSLAYRPRLLILDEPFSGLDPLVRDDFVRGVLELAAGEGVTIFLSSHEIEEVERLADRIMILDAGRSRITDTMERLQERFRRIEVNLGADHPAGPVPSTRPAHWSGWEQRGNRVTWTDSGYGPKSEANYQQAFRGAAVSAHPMTLKEIFLAVVRDGQAEKKGESVS